MATTMDAAASPANVATLGFSLFSAALGKNTQDQRWLLIRRKYQTAKNNYKHWKSPLPIGHNFSITGQA